MLTSGLEALASLTARGRFGSTAAVGFGRCGDARCGSSKLYGGVYQRRRTREGVKISRSRAYQPTDPQTSGQLARRAVFADAISTWGGLTSDTKALYDKRARVLKLSGYNLFIREYLRSH